MCLVCHAPCLTTYTLPLHRLDSNIRHLSVNLEKCYSDSLDGAEGTLLQVNILKNKTKTKQRETIGTYTTWRQITMVSAR